MSRDFTRELTIRFTTSSGPGGQNVNRRSTCAELRFPIAESTLLLPWEKQRIMHRLTNRINNRGELIITAQTERTRLLNQQQVIEKFNALIGGALLLEKPRRATRPTRSSRDRRKQAKQRQAQKKVLRSKKWPEM